MDDRTLIICAATLCVLGVSLTQTLGSSAAGRVVHSPAVAVANALRPAGELDSQSTLRTLRSFASMN